MRAPMLALLLLGASLAGCLGGSSSVDDDSFGVPDLSQPANWTVGQWWLYTFSTPNWQDDSARLVVTETDAEDGTAYMLGITNHEEARRHAVMNHNPFLGRITHDNLSTYENGVAQPVLQFPLEEGDSWSFTLFGLEWSTTITSVDDGRAVLFATTSDGQSLTYVYDGRAGFLDQLIWNGASGELLLRMVLVAHGLDYEGNAWFIRAGDIFDKEWDNSGGPNVEFEDSFFVSGHPSAGDYDEMIYSLVGEMGGGGSSGSLTLRDHGDLTPLVEEWTAGDKTSELGQVPYPSGEYTLTGTQSGDSYIRLIVAGGITTTWTV
ncbi:MAG: hypothetical protein VX320_01025 [Candidatus Thermoplasmatota archaeon]|nr:hypothetical protein [Candidatus Thermoplasmatota archaeon]